ncbi:MAG TPA: hypothetical protein DDY18_04535 [Flavobacterium sp.]|jgi:DNA-directed RNA polymerase specialized sigma24 family protein|nr:hypothetical protein [Flavobacterium sp.]
MKRETMILKIATLIVLGDIQFKDQKKESPETTAANILNMVEKLGMKPPSLPSDHQQAIMQVYYDGYTMNQWEEDFDKDPKVVAALQRRLEAAQKRKEKYEKK